MNHFLEDKGHQSQQYPQGNELSSGRIYLPFEQAKPNLQSFLFHCAENFRDPGHYAT